MRQDLAQALGEVVTLHLGCLVGGGEAPCPPAGDKPQSVIESDIGELGAPGVLVGRYCAGREE